MFPWSGDLVALALVATLALTAGGAARAEPAHAGPRAPGAESAALGSAAIAVELTGFRSDRGRALVALFDSPKGFPDKGENAVARVAVRIHNRKAQANFAGLRPGTYAIAALHDEDGDQKMRIGLFGIPKEGYGASRDPRRRFGPPRFDDARLSLGPGQRLRAPIRIIYR